MVVYNGLEEDCEIYGDPWYINNTFTRLKHVPRNVRKKENPTVIVRREEMSELIKHCEEIHVRLFSFHPEKYYELGNSYNNISRSKKLAANLKKKVKSFWDRKDKIQSQKGNETNDQSASDQSRRKSSAFLWRLNLLNSLFIFPGTKWCGQGAVAEHVDDLGYHEESDRCCR